MTFAGTEFSETGLLTSDSITSVTLTSAGAAATANVAGSPYAIVPSAAVGSGLGNYTINYANGSLTVNPAPLTVTAVVSPTDIGHGGTVPTPTFTYSGFVNGDTAAARLRDPRLLRAAHQLQPRRHLYHYSDHHRALGRQLRLPHRRLRHAQHPPRRHRHPGGVGDRDKVHVHPQPFP